MAHFAELDKDNVVTRIIVIANKDILDKNNVEQEQVGIAFCQSLFGQNTNWIQTSYNGSTRGKYAIVGDTYNADIDKFISVEPVPLVLFTEEIIDAEIVQSEIEAPVEATKEEK